MAPEKIAFTKMEGAGNDYVYVETFGQEFDLRRGGEIAAFVADRHFGVGSDGLIALGASDVADVRMHMWNADGSRGRMCGNGLRCSAKLAYDLGRISKPELSVETDAGTKDVRLMLDEQGTVVGAQVDMGEVPIDVEPRTVRVAGRDWAYISANAGSPHAVIFVDEDPDDLPLALVGAAVQENEAFPDGVNVELVAVLADGSLRQRTFERGSGETLACGSGATAVACVAMATGRVPGPEALVRLTGGSLIVRREGSGLVMEGPARTVFTGEIGLPSC